MLLASLPKANTFKKEYRYYDPNGVVKIKEIVLSLLLKLLFRKETADFLHPPQPLQLILIPLGFYQKLTM